MVKELIGMHIKINEEKFVYISKYLGRGASCAAYICKVFNKEHKQIGWATLKEFLPCETGFPYNKTICDEVPAFEFVDDSLCLNNEQFPSFISRVLPACKTAFKQTYIEYYDRFFYKYNLILDEINKSPSNSVLMHNIVLPKEIIFSPRPQFCLEKSTYECDFVDDSYIALCLTEFSKDSVIEELQNISLREKLEVISLLCKTVNEFHKLNIVFLDLKPENFLFVTHPQKLIEIFDLDSVQKTDANGRVLNTSVFNDRGTPFYSAPEVRHVTSNRGIWSDVYSITAMLIKFVFGDIIELTNSTHTRFFEIFDESNLKKINDNLKPNEEKITIGFWNKLEKIAQEGMSRVSFSGRYRNRDNMPVLALMDDVNILLDIYNHKGVHPEVMLDRGIALSNNKNFFNEEDFEEKLLCDIEEVN